MPERRVVLKKTGAFAKGGGSRDVRRYLARYVDEVGKEGNPNYEHPRVRERREKAGAGERRIRGRDDHGGRIWCGGFLGNGTSPGREGDEKGKAQREWIRQYALKWGRELEKRGRASRRNDGIRFVLSLGPEAVQALTRAKLATGQALREIWRKTVELYRIRHGAEDQGGQLAWAAGLHHDTDNAHLHVVVFPTTRDGRLIRAGNARRSEKGREDDLNAWIGMANIAAEIQWRENLPLGEQSLEYRASIEKGVEPPLPKADDFAKRSGVDTGREERPSGGEIDPEEEAEMEGEPADKETIVEAGRGADGAGGPRWWQAWGRRRRRTRGIEEMEALALTGAAWRGKKASLLETLSNLSGGKLKPSGGNDKEQALAAKILEDWDGREAKGLWEAARGGRAIGLGGPKEPWEPTWAAMSLAIGREEAAEGTPKGLARLEWVAERAEAAAVRHDRELEGKATGPSETVLAAVDRVGGSLMAEAALQRQRLAGYRRLKHALRRLAMGRDKEAAAKARGALAQAVLLCRGGLALARAMEAKAREARATVSQGPEGRRALRKEDREWKVEDGKIIVGPSRGKPWPRHLDPETVLEPLKGAARQEELLEELRRGRVGTEQEELGPQRRWRKALEETDGEEAEKTEESIGPVVSIMGRRARVARRRQRQIERQMRRERRREMGGPDLPGL